MTKSVYIIEDEPEYREHVIAVIGQTPGYKIVGSSASLPKSFSILKAIAPSILILDLELKQSSALSRLCELRAQLEQTRIVILSAYYDDQRVFTALASGADGYLEKKGTPPLELIRAIEQASRGESPISGAVAQRIVQSFRGRRVDQEGMDSLSPRERETLKHLAHGATNSEIAERLQVSEVTVRTHVHRVLKKLRARTRVEASRKFFRM